MKRISYAELTVTINLAQNHRRKRFRRRLVEFGGFFRLRACGKGHVPCNVAMAAARRISSRAPVSFCQNHGKVRFAMKIKTADSQLSYNILIEKKNSFISAIYAL